MKAVAVPIPFSRWIILAGVGALTSLFLLYYLQASFQYEGSDDSQTGEYVWFIAALIGAITLVGLELLSTQLDRWFPWQRSAGNRLLVGFPLVAFFVYLVASISFAWGFGTPEEGTANATDEHLSIKLAILSVIFSLIYAVVYFARYSYKSFATMQIETIRQERKQIDLQLKALKSQLSPHFLFNSLNSVSTLIYKQDPNARVFVRKLALMYQYVLDSYEHRLVTVGEELNFASAYGNLLQTRFGKSLMLDADIEGEVLATKVPPVTLQMLVENAVKHNIIDDHKQLHIRIYHEGNYLVVSNNITQKNKNAKSHKIGLSNIASRYELLTGKKTIVTQGDFFTVKLPVIP